MPTTSRHPDRYYWVVVADDSHATVYLRSPGSEPLGELFAVDNRAEGVDAANAFADEIAELVRKALQGNSCHGYALIAPPGFLGKLRVTLAAVCDVQPYQAMDSNLVREAAIILQKTIDSD